MNLQLIRNKHRYSNIEHRLLYLNKNILLEKRPYFSFIFHDRHTIFPLAILAKGKDRFRERHDNSCNGDIQSYINNIQRNYILDMILIDRICTVNNYDNIININHKEILEIKDQDINTINDEFQEAIYQLSWPAIIEMKKFILANMVIPDEMEQHVQQLNYVQRIENLRNIYFDILDICFEHKANIISIALIISAFILNKF